MNLRRLIIVFLLLGTGTAGYLYSGSSPEPERNTGHEQTTKPTTTEAKRNSSEGSASSPSDERNDQGTSQRKNQSTDSTREYDRRRARVLRVYDGDSLKVQFVDNRETAEVRLMGIDCPETSEEVDKCGPGGLVDLPCEEQIPLGIRAKSYAKTLLEEEVITLESYNNFERGHYDRVLAYVRTPEGEDYGLKTIKKGYCNDSGRIYDHPRDDKYERHQRPLKR